MMFSDGVRAPLISDLQKKFNLQCTVDGKKGILFKHEEIPAPSPRSAFDCSSGFVPFRKTKISSFLIQHPPKPWESSIQTRPHCWKSWDGTNRSDADARDALYMYSCKVKRQMTESGVGDRLPMIFQSKPRPNTVAKSRMSGTPRCDSHGHRRSYTAVERSKTDQVRARKALMKREYRYAQNLNTDKSAFFAVRKVFPANQKPEENGKTLSAKAPRELEKTEVRSSPRLSVRIDRPMKKEKGRYRPFSRTVVRTPKLELETSTVDHKGPQSAEAYKAILHIRREQLRQQRKRNASLSTPISQFRRTNNTMVSHYEDTETKLLQSVIEVNKPPSRLPSATPVTPAHSVRGTSAKGNEATISE